MTKPTLKERLEKKWLGRRVFALNNGLPGRVVEVLNNAESELCPLVVQLETGSTLQYAPHALVRLKPKKKQKRVTHEELEAWFKRQFGWSDPANTGAFHSLCDLLGVGKP